jgi:DNA-binding CsgD family transcriptional regulator
VDPSAVIVARASVARIFDALGTDNFELEALRFLSQTCGVEDYTVYRMRGPVPEVIGGASVRGRHVLCSAPPKTPRRQRAYPDLISARTAALEAGGPVMVHMELAQITEPELHSAFDRYDIIDRVLVCGLRREECYAISLLRSGPSGRFCKKQLSDMSEAADMLISAFAKHANLVWDRGGASKEFSSVELIEGRLAAADRGLSTRELQVSARILYGISTVGIALDLEVGEETVATYRKRAYQRLGIGSRHELFQLYLALL